MEKKRAKASGGDEKVFHSVEEFEKTYFPKLRKRRAGRQRERLGTGFAQQFLEGIKRSLEQQQ
jgi:hypothetical protein